MTGNLTALTTALVATLALTPVARRAALHLRIVDRPDGQRKLQRQPVPLLGGLAVLAGWWLGLAATALCGFAVPLPAALPQAAITLAALALVGLRDDICNLRARWKLLAQVAAAVPLALSGCGLAKVACCGGLLDLGLWGPAVTVVWLVVGINSLNLLDGMDGMASLTGLGICLTAAALDASAGGSHVGMFVLALAGALAGFLAYNRPPARIYLGDTGSMIVGLAVSLASMRVARTPDGVTHLTPMLALMALPLADTLLAVLRRRAQRPRNLVSRPGPRASSAARSWLVGVAGSAHRGSRPDGLGRRRRLGQRSGRSDRLAGGRPGGSGRDPPPAGRALRVVARGRRPVEQRPAADGTPDAGRTRRAAVLGRLAATGSGDRTVSAPAALAVVRQSRTGPLRPPVATAVAPSDRCGSVDHRSCPHGDCDLPLAPKDRQPSCGRTCNRCWRCWLASPPIGPAAARPYRPFARASPPSPRQRTWRGESRSLRLLPSVEPHSE